MYFIKKEIGALNILAIIDSDTVVYKAAGACQRTNPETKEIELKEGETVIHAYANAKHLMMQIMERTKCSDYRAFLTESSDSNCFRTKLYPEYKANRKDKKRPIFYHEVREYLIKHWKAEVVHTIEADDAVCIQQWEEYRKDFTIDGGVLEQFNYPAVLCGIDKDLNQIPGLHYNYDKDNFFYVAPIEGLRSFYTQMLDGDTADNIPRIQKGWGRKKEEKEVRHKLELATTEKEMYNIVFSEYERLDNKQHSWDDLNRELLLKGQLLYLLRHDEDKYGVPT